MLPSNINSFRGANGINLLKLAGLTPQDNTAKQLRYLFHNLSLENHPAFYGKFNDLTERRLELSAILQQNDFLKNVSSLFVPNINGIELSFSLKKCEAQMQQYKSAAIFGDNGIVNQTLPRTYQENISATYLAADHRDAGTLSRLSEIIKKKGGDNILRTLQDAFDKNIIGLQPLEDGIFFNLEDVDEYVPSVVMGSGVRRFLDIVTSVFEKRNSFVCIDEIENGLHYSAYRRLWETIITFSKQNNVQLFITTHSIETLVCLKSVLEETKSEDMRNFSKVFAVSKTTKSEFKTYKYSFEEFKTAIDNDIELRR